MVQKGVVSDGNVRAAGPQPCLQDSWILDMSANYIERCSAPESYRKWKADRDALREVLAVESGDVFYFEFIGSR